MAAEADVTAIVQIARRTMVIVTADGIMVMTMFMAANLVATEAAAVWIKRKMFMAKYFRQISRKFNKN